jgi:hypothetical protein
LRLRIAKVIMTRAEAPSWSTAWFSSRGAHAGLNFLGGGCYLTLLLLAGALKTIGAPANDYFADSISFTASSTNLVVDNSLATIEPSEPLHPPPAAGHTLWWKWTAPGDGWVEFSENDPSTPVSIAVYTGNALTNLALAQQILERWFDYSSSVIRTNPHPQWVVRAGQTYRIVASAVTNDTGLITGVVDFNVNFVEGPANDYFPGMLLTSLPNTAATGNWGASHELDEPFLVDTGLGASLWWSWQATQRGRLNIHAVNYYPTFGVFTGDAVNQLTQVSGGKGNVSVPVQPGRTYRIGVDTWPGDGVFIGFTLEFIPSPTNDDFATAIPISGAQACMHGCNHGATSEAGEEIFPLAAAGTVWYSWVSPVEGSVVVEAGSTNGRPVFVVYEGQSLTNLTVVAKSGFPSIPNPLNHVLGYSSGSFDARAGVEYKIAVDTWPVYGDEPNFDEFELCVDETTLRIVSPTNGQSFAASELPVFTLNAPLKSVDGAVKFVDYQQSRTYSGTWGYSLGTSTNPPFTATAHYIFPGLWSVRAVATNALGQERISPTVFFKVRPANDDFTNSTVLTGSSWGLGFPPGLNVRGSTQFATAEAGEPAHGGTPAVATVWYSWTAPSSGVAHFYYTLNDAETIVAVYSGDNLSQLQSIPLTHPFGSAFDVFGTVKGTTYRFAVGAESSDLEEYPAGFGMGLELVAPPPPAIGVLPGNVVPPHVVVSGIPGQQLVIEISADLSHWSPISTNTIFTGTWEFVDSEAGNNSTGFYRAVVHQ